jgi:hypothetical protein
VLSLAGLDGTGLLSRMWKLSANSENYDISYISIRVTEDMNVAM